MNVSVNISLIPAVFLNVKSLTVFLFFFLAARRLMLTTTNSSWCPVVGPQGQVMSEVGGSRGWNRRQCPSPLREPGTTAASLGAPSDPLSAPLALHPPSGHQLQKNTPGVHIQRKTVSVCFLGCVFIPHPYLLKLLRTSKFSRENLSWTPGREKAKSPVAPENFRLRNFHSELIGPWFSPL